MRLMNLFVVSDFYFIVTFFLETRSGDFSFDQDSNGLCYGVWELVGVGK